MSEENASLRAFEGRKGEGGVRATHTSVHTMQSREATKGASQPDTAPEPEPMIKVERASVEGEVVFIRGTPYGSQPSCLDREIILCSACVCMCGRQAMEGGGGRSKSRRRTVCWW